MVDIKLLKFVLGQNIFRKTHEKMITALCEHFKVILHKNDTNIR